MLKLSYTDGGVHMEYVTTSFESVLMWYVVLAVRLGLALHIEPSRASFLLPRQVMPRSLQRRLHPTEAGSLLAGTGMAGVTISAADAGFVEVSIVGLWISERPNGHDGTFLSTLGASTECELHDLWQRAQQSFVC